LGVTRVHPKKRPQRTELNDTRHKRNRTCRQHDRGPEKRKVGENAYAEQEDSHTDPDWPFDSTDVVRHDITSMILGMAPLILHLKSASGMPGRSMKNRTTTKHLERRSYSVLGG
jgi:hypothetical protein